MVTSRSPSGFTLIEVLMAMTIFLIGMTGLLALMSSALVMHRAGLAAGTSGHHVDGIAERLAVEVSAGDHWDDDAGDWIDVSSRRFDDGTYYSVSFEARPDGETVLVRVTAASDEAGLAGARPVPFLLTATPDPRESVAQWRARAVRRD